MKGNERAKWLELSTVDVHYGPIIAPQSLCHFCHYAQWSFDSICSEDGDLECDHKLDVIYDSCFYVWEGQDCWGFRPDISWDDAVEYTSQRMQNNYPVYPSRHWRKTEETRLRG